MVITDLKWSESNIEACNVFESHYLKKSKRKSVVMKYELQLNPAK